MLLAGAGEMGMLLCDQCDGPIKRARGCGVPPVFDFDGGEVTWSIEWFEDYCAKRKDPQEPDAPGLLANGETAAWVWHTMATDTYETPLANFGYAQELTGTLWRCCPRYYAEFVGGEIMTTALDIIDAARWIERGASMQEAFDGLPTAAAKAALGMTLDAREKIDAEKEARRNLARQQPDIAAGGF